MALVPWCLKLPAWKIEDRMFVSSSGIQVSMKQNVSSALIRKKIVLWGTSVSSASDRQGSI